MGAYKRQLLAAEECQLFDDQEHLRDWMAIEADAYEEAQLLTGTRAPACDSNCASPSGVASARRAGEQGRGAGLEHRGQERDPSGDRRVRKPDPEARRGGADTITGDGKYPRW